MSDNDFGEKHYRTKIFEARGKVAKIRCQNQKGKGVETLMTAKKMKWISVITPGRYPRRMFVQVEVEEEKKPKKATTRRKKETRK